MRRLPPTRAPVRRRRTARAAAPDPRALEERLELQALVALRGQPGYGPAVQAFALKNQGLAWDYAERWRCREVPQEELRQQALIGVLEAIERWDPKRRTRFSSYAMFRMRYQVERYLRKKWPLVHLPLNVLGDRAVIEKVLRQAPLSSPGELAAASGLSPDRVARALAARRGLSFELHQERDGPEAPPDLDLRRLLRAAVGGDPEALAELAEHVGVPVEEVLEHLVELRAQLEDLE